MPSIAVPGVINMRGAKPARPAASPKGFVWPSHRSATDSEKRNFATALARFMRQSKHTHITLAKYLWGTTSAGGTAGTLIAKWFRLEKFPSEHIAAYIAAYFKVSLADLMDPQGQEYKYPDDLVVTKAGKSPFGLGKPKIEVIRGKAAAAPEASPPAVVTEPVKQKKKYPKKVNGNGHDDNDSRWVLPVGVSPPKIMIQTSDTHPSLTVFQAKAEVPPHVAMALYTMLQEYKPAE